MKKTETYKLGKMKQLIDLNGDVTNFDLTFNVTSKDGSEFEALVVDQATLDNNPNIEYKKAPGTISGNIVADKNVYQNYFLLLKSENPCDCTVTTEMKSIQPNPNFIKEQHKHNTPTTSEPKKLNEKPPSIASKVDFKKILIVLAIIGLAVFVYFKFFKKKSDSKDGKIEDEKNAESAFDTPKSSKPTSPRSVFSVKCTKDICSPKIDTPVKTPLSIKTPPSLFTKKINESLIDKLKSLPNIKKT
jgi:hypothetical protein